MNFYVEVVLMNGVWFFIWFFNELPTHLIIRKIRIKNDGSKQINGFQEMQDNFRNSLQLTPTWNSSSIKSHL